MVNELRKEHKPLIILKIQRSLNSWYTKRILRPQFDSLGKHPFFLKPQFITLAGKNIHAGNHLHIIGDKNKPVNISTWSSKQQQGNVSIGSHCLISPGVNIASAVDITIGDNCMIAADVNISDSDWHGIYNRTRPFRCSAPVHLKSNVWIGLKAIIGKGVTIGENSVVAAGSVVIQDVPDNTIVGGNPAKIIKHINPNKRMLTREFLFQHSQQDDNHYIDNQKQLDAYLFNDNSTWHWLKTKIAPSDKD